MIGHYCPYPDEEPIQCPPGFAQINLGQVQCDKCPAGSYADKAGMGKCIPCPPGMFCPDIQNAPLSCPTNRLGGQTKCDLGNLIGWKQTQNSLSLLMIYMKNFILNFK